MAATKISALAADTAPSSDDLAVTVNDPGGVPANRKVTLANLITKAHGLSDGVVKVASSIMAVASYTDFGLLNRIGTFAAPITDNPYPLSAANAYNTTLFYGATGEIDLPAAVAGMNIVIYNTGAFTITIDPDGTDVIVREGTAQAAGVSMTLSSGAGNFVAMVCDVANHWVTLGKNGTLAVGA